MKNTVAEMKNAFHKVFGRLNQLRKGLVSLKIGQVPKTKMQREIKMKKKNRLLYPRICISFKRCKVCITGRPDKEIWNGAKQVFEQ